MKKILLSLLMLWISAFELNVQTLDQSNTAPQDGYYYVMPMQ